MKYLILSGLLSFFAITASSCSNSVTAEKKQGTNEKEETVVTKTNANDENKVIHLDKESFKQLVFDYENNKEWKYNGNVPAILDFYADWCG